MRLCRRIGCATSESLGLNKAFRNLNVYLDHFDYIFDIHDISQGLRDIEVITLNDYNTYFACGGNLNISFCRMTSIIASSTLDTNKSTIQNQLEEIFNFFESLDPLLKTNIKFVIIPIFPSFSVHIEAEFNETIIEFLKKENVKKSSFNKKILFQYQFSQAEHDLFHTIEKIEESLGYEIPTCFDFPSCYHILGRGEFLQLLQKYQKKRKITKFYIADLRVKEDIINLNAPVGNGEIHWNSFLPFFKDSILTFTVKGSIIAIKNSMSYLASLAAKKYYKITEDGIINGFFFSKSKKSFFQVSPGIKMIYNFLEDQKIEINTILDLGCGNGRNSFYFAKRYNPKIHLIDLDRDLLERVIALFKVFNIRSVKFDIVDLENINNFLSLFSNSYDLVFFSYVLQNINPSKFFSVMDFCRKITKKLIVFEIYINVHIYPQGFYTRRGETSWYGFSQDEVFKLFETFFDVIAWTIKKGKTNPLMISIIGKPKEDVENSKIIFKKYKTIQHVNYRDIKPLKGINNVNQEVIRKRKTEKENFVLINLWGDFSSYLKSTGITQAQITSLKQKLNELNGIIPLNYREWQAALIFLTARDLGIPIHLQEIIKKYEITKKVINSKINKLKKLGYFKNTIPDLKSFFSRYYNYLALNKYYEVSSESLFTDIEGKIDLDHIQGIPHIISLATVIVLVKGNVNLNEIAKETNVSPLTLKNKLELIKSRM